MLFLQFAWFLIRDYDLASPQSRNQEQGKGHKLSRGGTSTTLGKNCRLRPFRLRSAGHSMTDDEVVAHGSVYGCADVSSASSSPPGKMTTLSLEPPLAGRCHARRRCSLLWEDEIGQKTRCPLREGARTGTEFSETYTPTPSIPCVRMYVTRNLIIIMPLQK